MREVPALFEPQAQRYTADQLRDLERETDSAGRGGRGGRGAFPGGRGGAPGFAPDTHAVSEGRGRPRHHHAWPRHRRHGVRRRRRLARAERSRHGTGGDDRRRALRPDPPHAAEEPAGADRPGGQEHVLRRPDVLQRGRRDSRNRQGRRDRDARRALRLVAGGHRRDRQRRRLGGHDGSDADPQAGGPAVAPHGAHRPLGRRRTGPHRIARLRHRDVRRPRDDDRSSRPTRSSRATSTSTTARARSAASTCKATRASRRSSKRG